MLLRRQAFDTRMSYSLGRKVNSTPTEIDKFTSEHCRGVKPKASAKTTGNASGKTYMIAQTVAAIVLVRNTIGSVQKSRTGRTNDVSQNAPKLGTLSIDSKYRPLKPDAREMLLISRRTIVEGRNSFINKQRIAEKPDTAADKLNTHGLRTN